MTVGARIVPVIHDSIGRWFTTGEARGWPRCERCRWPSNEILDRFCWLCRARLGLPWERERPPYLNHSALIAGLNELRKRLRSSHRNVRP